MVRAISLFHLPSSSPFLLVSTEFGSHLLSYSSTNMLESVTSFEQSTSDAMDDGMVLACGWLRDSIPQIIMRVTQSGIRASLLDKIDTDKITQQWVWKSSGFISAATTVGQWICIAESHEENHHIVFIQSSVEAE